MFPLIPKNPKMLGNFGVSTRLAYAPAAPELIERFPQRVDGVELARKYLLALLPLSEKLGSHIFGGRYGESFRIPCYIW